MSKYSDRFLNDYTTFITLNIVLPNVIMDNYIFISCISETPKKNVYLLRSKHSENLHLLKCCSEKAAGSLADEYKLLKSMNHPGISRVEFFFEQDGTQYLILDYFEGITLKQYVNDIGLLSDSNIIHIMLQMCDIVSYLHTLDPPVIHRDIKPQNIIYTKDGNCKLIDFDIARRFRSHEKSDTECLGTRCTAAPEQFGYMQTSTKTDIYAMGILMLYLLTGSFEPTQVTDVKNGTLARIISKCIRFDPKNRYSSVAHLKRSLKKAAFIKKDAPRIAIAAGLTVCTVIACLIAGLTLKTSHQNFPEKKHVIPASVSVSPQSTIHVAEASQNVAPVPTNTPISSAEIAELNEPVTLSSKLIENAVRLKLGLSATDPITMGDLSKIQRLYICGNDVYNNWDNVAVYSPYISLYDNKYIDHGNISALDDLTKMKNLKELALFNQSISDISLIKDMKLTKLALGGNNISDISALSGCKELEVIILNNNPIKDITPLSSLPSLKDLDIGDTDVRDFSPVIDCPLEKLNIMNCPIQSYYALTKLKNLNDLSANYLNSEDISLLSEMTCLERIRLHNSDIPALSVLYKLKNLTFLCIGNSNLADISGISELSGLTDFDLAFNPISDISSVQNSNLTYISIAHTKVTNCDVLAQIPNLMVVGCSPDQEENVRRVLAGRPVDIGIVN